MKDIRVNVKLRNERLVRYREELGMSPPKIARAIGISYQVYLSYENMKSSPLSTLKKHSPSVGPDGLTGPAAKICDFHGVGPDELWPGEMATIRLTGKAYSFAISLDEAHALAGRPPDKTMLLAEVSETLASSLSELTPREHKIIAMRFGLEGNEPMTCDAIGEKQEVTKERIRQIEAKALRKLRGMKLIQALQDEDHLRQNM